MKRVQREEILPLAEYEKVRPQFRARVMALKNERRIHVGEYLTFLFEHHDTVLYQVQEMMRAERMQGDAEIRHELETYNELLGGRGELGCTLLIEIEDAATRDQLLAKWTDLPSKIWLETQAGKRVPAEFDPRQVGDRRASSVQYLKFHVGDGVPVRMGCDHTELKIAVELEPIQVGALVRDLVG